MWYIYTMEYYSAIKNEIMPFAAIWMDQEIIILNEVRQRKTNIIWHHLYVESKKKSDANELIYKTETDSDLGNKHSYRREAWGTRDRLGVWDWHTHTAIFKIDKQQGPVL